MRFAIFFIALLATTQATQTLMERFPLNISEKRSIMSLMIQVENTIKAGGPYDAIIRILDEFEQGIKDEQQKHNELNEENIKTCQEEKDFRDNAIREADGAIKEATQTLDGCVAQLSRAESDLKAADSQLANARMSLGALERQRIAEQELFNKDIIAYKALLNGIDEALQIIQDLKASEGSFIQITKHTNKLMLQAAQVKQISKLSGVMAAMTQLTTGGNDAIFTKLNGLFEGFKHDTQEKKRVVEETEANAIAHYNTVKSRLTQTISKLVELIDNLTAEILELRQCISMQQSLLAAAKAKWSRNTNLLKSATSVCEAAARSYEQQTAARKDELDLLVAIKHKVHERFNQIENEHGTIDRAMASNEELVNSYDNKSEYEHKSFQGI